MYSMMIINNESYDYRIDPLWDPTWKAMKSPWYTLDCRTLLKGNVS